jgi:hypothetical protein
MRVLMIAPFERGRDHGGSQRATAVAERLEERGVEVGWEVLRRRDTTRRAKLRAAARLEPALCGLYEPLAALAPGAWDAALIAHSYLVPGCAAAAEQLPVAVDFHNLEWRHLADAGGRSGVVHPRRLYELAQVRLMHRLERTIAARCPLTLFVSAGELAWAQRVAPEGRGLLVPSVLPAGAHASAAAIAESHAPEPGHLVYVGTLTFPTNVVSLRRFLDWAWPAMRAAVPELRLSIAGRCEDAVRAEFERSPGVSALGFVEDLPALLTRAQAIVMPFEGTAGTSLRALFYTLCGLPTIGSPDAFRGVPFAAGTAVSSTAQWARAVRALAAGELSDAGTLAAARRAAELHQRDPEPWDHLHAALTGVARQAPTPAGAGV